jgi:hypothetical protein
MQAYAKHGRTLPMLKRTILIFCLLLLPVAVLLAGPVQKTWLSRGDGAGEESTARGFLKTKLDKKGELHLFSVKVKDVGPGTYGVYLVDPEDDLDPGTELGSIEVAADEDGGKLKMNARRGDTMPEDAEGMCVEVRDGAGGVVLKAIVPEYDAPKSTLKGNVKEKLALPAEDPADEKAKGFIRLKLGKGAQLLQIVLQRATAGTYDVFMDDGTGTLVDVGDIVVPEGEDSGSFLVNTKRGDPIPTDAESLESLMGRAVEVRTGGETPATVLEGEVPEITGKKGNGPK